MSLGSHGCRLSGGTDRDSPHLREITVRMTGKDQPVSPMSSEGSPAAMPSMTEVKSLFGMMLDAAEVRGASAEVREAKAAFDAARPEVRAAVEKLLAAHGRASGVLLEGAVAADPKMDS